MGAVDAELVGASCGGGEAQQGGTAAVAEGDDTQHFVERVSWFAVGEIGRMTSPANISARITPFSGRGEYFPTFCVLFSTGNMYLCSTLT